jgi:hypothetical protein
MTTWIALAGFGAALVLLLMRDRETAMPQSGATIARQPAQTPAEPALPKESARISAEPTMAASRPPSEPTAAPQATVERERQPRPERPKLPDPRLERLLESVEKGLAKAKQDASPHWMPAVLHKLMQQQRYYYLGPRDQRPQYANSADTRYISTNMEGLEVVFEIPRAEFPEAFAEANYRFR